MNEQKVEDIIRVAKSYLDRAERSLWMAGISAERAKAAFENTERIGRWSWTDFCESAEGLDRNVDTVWSYVRAVRYCDKWMPPGWRQAQQEIRRLPAIALVGELAGVADEDARARLHGVLWSGEVGSTIFRKMIREAKETLKEGVLNDQAEEDQDGSEQATGDYSADVQPSSTTVQDKGTPSLIRMFGALQPQRNAINKALQALKPGETYIIQITRAE